jgi:hypothetical protein
LLDWAEEFINNAKATSLLEDEYIEDHKDGQVTIELV